MDVTLVSHKLAGEIVEKVYFIDINFTDMKITSESIEATGRKLVIHFTNGKVVEF